MTKRSSLKQVKNNKFEDTENISSGLSLLENIKYKFHKHTSSIFGDSEYVRNYVNLKNDYLAINDIIPTWLYDEEAECFVNENSVGFILEGNTLTGASEKTVKTITNLITDGIPEGAIVQVTNFASPKINNLFKVWESQRGSSKEIYQNLAKKRTDHFSKHNWESLFLAPFLLRDFRIIISVSIPIINDKKDILSKITKFKESIFNKISANNKEDEQIDLSNQISELTKIKKSFISTFKSVGIFTFEYRDKEILSFLDEIINPNRNNKEANPLNYRADSSISDQLKTDNMINVNKNHISLFSDDKNNKVSIKSFNVRTYPEYFALWQGNDLLGEYYNDLAQIPCPFLTSFTIRIPHNVQTKHAKILAKATRAIQQSETTLAKYIPELREKAEDFKFTTRHIREGQKLVDIYFQITLLSPPEKLEEASQIIKSIYKKKKFDIIAERYMQLQSYMSLIPFNMSEGIFDDLQHGGRTDTAITWTCANLMPLLGETLGNIESPCMMLFGRRGQPLFWNPFANKGGNYNTAVVGKSGSGKSVFMQELVTNLLGFGGKVYVVDDGRSFMNSCKLQEGAFMEFVHHSKTCINPFSLLSGENENNAQKYDLDDVLKNSQEINNTHNSEAEIEVDNDSEILILINTMVRQMARSQSSTCEIENSFISEAIDKAYKMKGRKATITTVRDILQKNDDNRAKDIAKMLRPFSVDGEYKSYFEGECNITIENIFMVFELSEIKNKKDLQGIVMQFIMFLVFQEMYMGDRTKSISIVIDEAWDLLHGEETGKFIEGLARRARKYRGNIITGTQSINDYYKTPATKAIIENSDWTCLLAQKPESVEAFKNSGRILMDEEMETILKSLKMVDHQYSEVMICGGGGYITGRLIVDPYAIALYSSKAEDFNKIKELTKNNAMSIAEALEQIIGNKKELGKVILGDMVNSLAKLKEQFLSKITGDSLEEVKLRKSISDKFKQISDIIKL